MEMISRLHLLFLLADSTFLFLPTIIMIGFGHCGAIQEKIKKNMHNEKNVRRYDRGEIK
jgi:hypothetical protein